MRRKAYGWCPVKLSDAYTKSELAAWIQEIMADPTNANPDHARGRTIDLYTKAAKRKTDALGWAIYHRQQGGLP